MSRCDQGEGGTTLLNGVFVIPIVDITKVPDFNKVCPSSSAMWMKGQG